jgi:hypothetical protein
MDMEQIGKIKDHLLERMMTMQEAFVEDMKAKEEAHVERMEALLGLRQRPVQRNRRPPWK